MGSRAKRLLEWIPLALLLAVHIAGLVLLFEPIEGVLNNDPLIEQDYGLHYHHLLSLESSWKTGHRTWGYNPLFMAGYPSNTIQDASIKLFEFCALAMPGVAHVRAFKLIVFAATASVPLIMFLAALCFFASRGTAFVAAVLGTASWWNSLPREMFFYGMASFPVASYFSLLCVGVAYRVAVGGAWWTKAAFFLCAALLLPLHPQSVVIAAPSIFVLCLTRSREGAKRFLLWIVAGASAAILLNLPWLKAFATHSADGISGALVKELPVFTSNDPWAFAKDYLSPEGYWTFRTAPWEKLLRLTFLGIGSAQAWIWCREKKWDWTLAIGGTAAMLFLLAYFGSFVPALAAWQPLRFKVPLDLILALAAAPLVTAAFATWRIDGAGSRYVVLIAMLVAGTGFVANLIATESAGQMRMRTGIPHDLKEIVDWVANEAPSDVRVLFEESGDETGFAYDGVYLSNFVAHETRRELIGGPANLYNDRHHFAEFHSGRLCKRDIRSLSDEEVRAYFKLYNIGAVVAFDPRSIDRLLAMKDLVKFERRVGKVVLMKVTQPLNWFVEGNGTVHAEMNAIHCSNVSGNPVILKYHWIEGLRADPPAQIESVTFLDDPIPFIKIIDPPPQFVLRVGE